MYKRELDELNRLRVELESLRSQLAAANEANGEAERERDAAKAELDKVAADIADVMEGKSPETWAWPLFAVRAAIDKAERERDAGMAVAFYVGRNLFGLTDDQIFERLGDTVRAWLDESGADERQRVSAAIRKAAGLDQNS